MSFIFIFDITGTIATQIENFLFVLNIFFPIIFDIAIILSFLEIVALNVVLLIKGLLLSINPLDSTIHVCIVLEFDNDKSSCTVLEVDHIQELRFISLNDGKGVVSILSNVSGNEMVSLVSLSLSVVRILEVIVVFTEMNVDEKLLEVREADPEYTIIWITCVVQVLFNLLSPFCRSVTPCSVPFHLLVWILKLQKLHLFMVFVVSLNCFVYTVRLETTNS